MKELLKLAGDSEKREGNLFCRTNKTPGAPNQTEFRTGGTGFVLPGAGCLQEPQGQAKGSGFRERGCYRSQKQRASVTTGALIGPGRVAAQARTPERGTTGAKQIGEEEDEQGI